MLRERMLRESDQSGGASDLERCASLIRRLRAETGRDFVQSGRTGGIRDLVHTVSPKLRVLLSSAVIHAPESWIGFTAYLLAMSPDGDIVTCCTGTLCRDPVVAVDCLLSDVRWLVRDRWGE